MKISYAIPVCNEHEELRRLLTLLCENKREEDEIVIQFDAGNTTPEVYQVVYNEFADRVKHVAFPLEKDFASFKNNLKANCSGDWIFQIDADEYLDPWLIKTLDQILADNKEIEIFSLPRINTVTGLTPDHIQKWGWRVDEKGWVNFPDYQTRILQNLQNIKWINKVHERLHGFTSYGMFPGEEEYCILHHKTIERQEAQNKSYESI